MTSPSAASEPFPPRLRLPAALLLLLIAAAAASGEGPAGRAPLPDLAVTAEDLVLPRPSLLEGAPVIVAVRVRNLGDAEARGFDVQIWDGAGQKRAALKTVAIASVPPRSDVLLTVDWTPRGPGLHQVSVAVDPSGRVPEGSRTNNTASRTVLILAEVQAQRNLYAYALQYVPRASREFDLLEAERVLVGAPPAGRGVAQLTAKAVDRDRGVIQVIGLGLRPLTIVSNAAALPAARRAAVLEAQRWLGLIQEHRGKAGGPVPAGERLFGAVVVGEQALPDGSVMVKLEAPLR
ncbi:MAG TPA: CARDB domain-containing protein [Candidatus Methylomirabilis sp.]|nr:CARDB domain-containing protein [Candidatus Methylomirabilis sp.]